MTDSKTAAAMRQEFDREFALPRGHASEQDDLIAVEVGGAPHVLRLAEIAGVLADRTIVAIPSSSPDLVGIVGFRGELLSVFDLGSLLGYPRAPSSRWIAVGSGGNAAFAFTRLIHHLRVPRTAIVDADTPSNIGAVVTIGNDVWPVISLDRITTILAQRLKEQ